MLTSHAYPRLALIVAALTVVLGGPALAQDGLIAHWPMDSAMDGVIADATQSGHDATFFTTGDSEPAFVDGIVGKALKLDGKLEQGLNVAKSEDFNFTGPFTVMAWVKPARRNATYEVACMKGDKSGDPPWPGWRLRCFWARLAFQVGTPEGEEPQVSTAAWSAPPNFWSHMAVTWDGKVLRAYVNAVEKASTEFEGTIAPQSSRRPLVLGNYIGRKNAYAFEGGLDDIKIFSGALSEEEILAQAAD